LLRSRIRKPQTRSATRIDAARQQLHEFPMLDIDIRPERSFQTTGKRIACSPVTGPVELLRCPRFMLVVLGLPEFEALDKFLG
jgi:hypothetical protein